jgi:hypothetical protein
MESLEHLQLSGVISGLPSSVTSKDHGLSWRFIRDTHAIECCGSTTLSASTVAEKAVASDGHDLSSRAPQSGQYLKSQRAISSEHLGQALVFIFFHLRPRMDLFHSADAASASTV